MYTKLEQIDMLHLSILHSEAGWPDINTHSKAFIPLSLTSLIPSLPVIVLPAFLPPTQSSATGAIFGFFDLLTVSNNEL